MISLMLRKADELHEEVEFPKEQALETMLFGQLMTMGLQGACTTFGNKQRTWEVFETKLRDQFSDRQANSRGIDFAEIGKNYGWQLFRPAPEVQTMVGPLSQQPKIKHTQRVARPRFQESEIVRPATQQNITEEDNKQETDKLMEEMYHCLRKHKNEKIPFVLLVLNKHSFSQTIENIFVLTFLIRDGKVSLYTDHKEGCVVGIAQKRQHTTEPNGQQEHSSSLLQCICSVTYDDWRTMLQAAGDRETIMKHREHNTQAMSQP
eukprot:TRINITY_DN7187_c0_g2_i1.p1 TRINITY_DN7187_c0_g2~~TRINITY_DN7187_c0_g2_i1.p1  ORF type:complete len:263 (-),score=17.93 TRINITY_DN7187_c0_g2_i1:214-1002(-)